MDGATKASLLERYSRAELSSVEVRQALGGITFGDVLIELSQRGLPLPRASQAGREEQISLARSWLFPASD